MRWLDEDAWLNCNIKRRKTNDTLTNLFEQDRLKASYGKSLEGKSMPKGSFQRPRLVRKGSKEAAEDGPGAVQVKAETVLACAGSAR